MLFSCVSVRFGSVRFGSVRFGSVRFGSVRFGSVFPLIYISLSISFSDLVDSNKDAAESARASTP